MVKLVPSEFARYTGALYALAPALTWRNSGGA
jgi:hypothetical protein